MIIHTNTFSYSIFKYILNGDKLSEEIVQQVGEFDYEFEGVSETHTQEDNIARVIINILERGNPTLVSPYVDEVLASHLDLLQRAEKRFEIDYSLTELEHPIEWIQDALMLVAPDEACEYRELYALDSEEEALFLGEKLDEYFGAKVATLLRKLVYPQRPLQTMLESKGKFHEQRVDFAWDLPGTDGKFIVEIDGQQHQEQSARMGDTQRDKALKKANWRVIRISTEVLRNNADKKLAELKPLVEHPTFQRMLNFTQQLDNTDFQELKLITLVPIAVGRIQRVLAELVDRGKLNWSESQHWQLAIYERDIPCAWLAISDLMQLLGAFERMSPSITTPKITLTIIRHEPASNLFAEVPDDLPFDCRIASPDDEFIYHQFDVLLDFALQQPPNWTSTPGNLLQSAKTVTTVRSTFVSIKSRKLYCTDPVEYQPDDEALSYFLRYFFRKLDFREGQRDIINRALMRKDVIGLLPTGGGKSICYQLPALLQPGVTLIIDPIKSLMLDQRDDLHSLGVDRAEFINSSLSTKQRQSVLEQMEQGRYQFLFISPERMQIEEFRNQLHKM